VPELPDIVVYIEALEARILGRKLERVRLVSPFLLRTVWPPLEAVEGKIVRALRRIGKRIAIGVEGDYWLVLHLMIAGRLDWREPRAKLAPRRALAGFDFTNGILILTETGSRKRAALHIIEGTKGLRALDSGGLETLEADLETFTARLSSENHTLKRALTDPSLLSGIGNAYSDEILHRARLSPIALTGRLKDEEIERLFVATRETLSEWIEKLRAEARGRFPEKVTAFRDGMAVHGRYGKPCPRCGTPVERIRYASNETNYCARCQTGGKLIADRALSRLLKQDWPQTLEELEALSGR
jgi:formamidopyrimidine-DNA glycosylase